ncbi:PON2 isoform 16 [Pongo abelii]|uniref:PON2 isoform 16 n=1 Tax=Pongo abelii TaxID=9601 RepID=A0A2J8WJN5_PONAB|nr:PON2 isoform 9 [Pongo abelii]PNJ69984.1 PON2 isoform 16 [Pongo abelii]
MGRLVAVGLLGIALALLGERLLALRNRLKASREVESVDLPNCHLIKGIEAGSEDIDILPNGLAFFSVVSVFFLPQIQQRRYKGI